MTNQFRERCGLQRPTTASGLDVAHPAAGSNQGPRGTPERVKSFAGALGCSLMSWALVQEYPDEPRPGPSGKVPVAHETPSAVEITHTAQGSITRLLRMDSGHVERHGVQGDAQRQEGIPGR